VANLSGLSALPRKPFQFTKQLKLRAWQRFDQENPMCNPEFSIVIEFDNSVERDAWREIIEDLRFAKNASFHVATADFDPPAPDTNAPEVEDDGFITRSPYSFDVCA
jgi:hypothetical protein